MNMSNVWAVPQSSYASHVQVVAVNISSKPTDPAGNGAKVDFTVIEGLGQTFAIKAQGVSELSVSFQMQARALQQHTPLCYSNVGTNSNPQLSRTAPAPPQMPPAPPFVGRFTGAQHTHGGHQGHGSCASIQAHPSSSLAAVQAHNNATGVSQLPIDVRGVAPAQSELPHQSSEETKPEHTPAFCNSSQTVNLQTNSSLLGIAPPGLLETAGKSGGLMGDGSGSSTVPKGNLLNSTSANNDAALAQVSSGSSSSPTYGTLKTSTPIPLLSSTASINTEDTTPELAERTSAFSGTPSKDVNLRTNSSLFGIIPSDVLETAGKSGGLFGNGSGSLFSGHVHPPTTAKGNLWTVTSVNNSSAPAQVSSGSSSPTSVTSTTSTFSSASLPSTASTNTTGRIPSLVISDPWPAPITLGQDQVVPGFPTRPQHSNSTHGGPEFPKFPLEKLHYAIPAIPSCFLKTMFGPYYSETDPEKGNVTLLYQSRGALPGVPGISHEEDRLACYQQFRKWRSWTKLSAFMDCLSPQFQFPLIVVDADGTNDRKTAQLAINNTLSGETVTVT